jgi:hypothetical protein
MRRRIGEQRIEAVIWSVVFVEAHVTVACAPLHQLGRCVMVLEIDDHSVAPIPKKTIKGHSGALAEWPLG